MRYPSDVEPNVQRALSVNLIKDTLQSVTDTLTLEVQFEPLKPLHHLVELWVMKDSGGRWKFEVELMATDPEVDDIVVIEAEMGSTESVSFALTNQFSTFAPFKAYIKPESQEEFICHPASGILEPFGSAGTNFVVSYSPTTYGKGVVCYLVILTDEMQWTYELRGTHPQYVLPDLASKVDNRLRPDVEHRVKEEKSKQRKKNFLRDNIKGGSNNSKRTVSVSGGVGGGGSKSVASQGNSSVSRQK